MRHCPRFTAKQKKTLFISVIIADSQLAGACGGLLCVAGYERTPAPLHVFTFSRWYV